MLKQKIQEIIAEGRIRNLSDEEIAEMVIAALKEEKSHGEPQQEQPQELDSVGD